MARVLPTNQNELAIEAGRMANGSFRGAFLLAQRPSIDGLEFDICESETHRSSAQVTSHPVEEGADISDHIIGLPDELELQLRVSNTPIVTVEDAENVTPGRAEAAYYSLLDLKRARETVGVITSLRRYEDMAIVSVAVTRNATTGQCVTVTVALREIRTATSETVEAPQPKEPRGQAKKTEGKKPTKPATPAVAEKASTTLLKIGRALSDNISMLTGG